MLTINNPSAPHNIVQYNYKERRFKPISYIDQTYIHLDITGNLVYRDSEEGRAYEIKKKSIIITVIIFFRFDFNNVI